MNHSSGMPSLNYKPTRKHFGLRGAIALVLAGFAGGAVLVGSQSGGESCDVPLPGISDTGEPDASALVTKSRSSNLIPADEFEGAPEEYVDIEKCRELVFRRDESVVTDDEIVKMAHDIETERLMAIADSIIAQFDIRNELDKDSVLSRVLEGCTEVSSVYQLSDGIWFMSITEPSGVVCNGIQFNEKPYGLPEPTEQEEKDREELKKMQEREKEIEKLLEENNINSAFENIDLDGMKEQIGQYSEKANNIMRQAVDQLETILKWLQEDLNDDEKKRLVCELTSLVFQFQEPVEDEMRPNADLFEIVPEFYKELLMIWELLIGFVGIEDETECLKY